MPTLAILVQTVLLPCPSPAASRKGPREGGGGGNGRKERGEMVSGRGNLRFRWVYSLFVLVYVLYASDSISEPNKEFMGNKLIESKNDRMIES